MTGKRVLFLTPQPFFTERGSPYRVRAEVQAILAQGFTVDLVAYPIGRDIEIPGLRVFRAPSVPGCSDVPIGWSWKKLLLDVALFFRALVLLCTNRYAVIHGVEDAGVMAAFLSPIFRVPYIFDMHSHMSEQLSQCILPAGGVLHRFVAAVEGLCMRRAAGVITVSDVITARVREIAPHTPALTLEDLALEGAAVEPEQVRALARELNLEGKKVILYTGNFEPYQGIDLLLDGFAAYVAKADATLPLAKLVIVGGGREDDSRSQFFRNRVKELCLESSVVFAGQRGEEEMGRFMAMADLLISPRLAGAHTPLKIYSYMFAGKPIIATRIAAHTNVLSEDLAFLGNPDPSDFGLAIFYAVEAIAQQPEVALAKSRLAKELLERRFSKREFQRRVGVLYRASLGGSHSEELLLSPEDLRVRAGQLVDHKGSIN